jgi:hypothetical protein
MNISLRVNDVGGQSINSKSLKQYLASATVVFLVYDTTNPTSFYDLNDWLVSVKKHAPNAKLYLIGNKVGHHYSSTNHHHHGIILYYTFTYRLTWYLCVRYRSSSTTVSSRRMVFSEGLSSLHGPGKT